MAIWGGNSAEELRERLPRPSTWMVSRKFTDRLEADIRQCIHSFTHPSPLQKQIFRSTAGGR